MPRAEYLRSSRGTEPGPDKSGEGLHEVNLHAGGMVYGEVFQYFWPKPDSGLVALYRDELGVPEAHIVTGGRCTYRNGDVVLALFQEYLRTGNETLHDFGRIHASVFADVSISHAPVSSGIGHYYCDWYHNPYVYQRFEGLLLAALVTGNAWWLENAIAMAEYCVRAWEDGAPRDGALHGTYGGVQYRSPYIAKMLLRLYEITGERKYAKTAVRFAKWSMSRQEPEGWWTMGPASTREFRNSPIFAGYACMGLWPLYWATRNPDLKDTLMKAVDYHVGMQEDASGNNPGTFPNSYWYGDNTSKDTPISGNYATTAHWAAVILEAYRLTGDPAYFYSANAAWVGVLNHQTKEGGLPLSNSTLNSVWSHVIVESLPRFTATAERDRLPFVLHARTGAPGTSFMGKGARWEDGTFSFDIRYTHDAGTPVDAFWPGEKPAAITVNGLAAPFTHEAGKRLLRFHLPPAAEFTVAHCRVAED